MVDKIFLFRSSSIISKKQLNLKFVKKYNLNLYFKLKCIQDTKTNLSELNEVHNQQKRLNIY